MAGSSHQHHQQEYKIVWLWSPVPLMPPLIPPQMPPMLTPIPPPPFGFYYNNYQPYSVPQFPLVYQGPPPYNYVPDFTKQFNAKKDPGASGKSKKKVGDTRWSNRTDKQGYTHPWLLTTLKGHTGQVLDMDFSSSGKYLVSCGDEEPDPGGDLANDGSSSSECNNEISRPSSADLSPRAKPLSRRQRKNRRREESSSPETKKKSKSKRSPDVANKKPPLEPPLINFEALKTLYEGELNQLLHSYLLSPEQMLVLGYPVESSLFPGRAVIFKEHIPSHNKETTYSTAQVHEGKESEPVDPPSRDTRNDNVNLNPDVREFVPYLRWLEVNRNQASESDSSGHGSGNSSDSGENDYEESSSDSSDQFINLGNVLPEAERPRTYQEALLNTTASAKAAKQPHYAVDRSAYSNVYSFCERTEAILLTRMTNENPSEKICARCGSKFLLTSDNQYVTKEKCCYHWGKLQRITPEDSTQEYMCCQKDKNSPGCTEGRCHVWSGLVPGFNGPYDTYVRTRRRKTPPPDGNYGIYALDCEMCYTSSGLELTKISVVGVDGRLVYDSYVRPENQIIDYNSRFSGITSRDINGKKCVVKSLRAVQNDLMGFINAHTVLIGHGLENDLRALRIIHPTIVDTSVSFPHFSGLLFKRSLKSLVSCFLHRDIQTNSNGHNSYEDARACMDLMLWRVKNDFCRIRDH